MVRHTEVLDWFAWIFARLATQGVRSTKASRMGEILVCARNQPIQPADRLCPVQGVEIILDAEHRWRVDRLADKDPSISLPPEVRRKIFGRGHHSCRTESLHRTRAEDQHAVGALTAEYFLPGEGDDVELVKIRVRLVMRQRSHRRSSSLCVSQG